MTVRYISAAAAVAGAALLSGCGTLVISGPKVVKIIRGSLADNHLTAKSISCPDNQSPKKGFTFKCVVKLTSGESVPIKVTVVNNKGLVSTQPTVEIATLVQSQIAAVLATRGVNATVSCPRGVAIAVGAQFDCQVSYPGVHAVTTLTITNADGHIVSSRLRVVG